MTKQLNLQYELMESSTNQNQSSSAAADAGISPERQLRIDAIQRQSYWRWAITLIYEDKIGTGVLTAKNLLRIYKIEQAIVNHQGYTDFCMMQCTDEYTGETKACTERNFPNATRLDRTPNRR